MGEHDQNRYRLEQCLDCVVDNRGKTPPLSDSGVELLEVNALEAGRKSPNFDKVRKYVSKNTYDTWFRSGHPTIGDTLISTVGAIGRVAYFKENRGCIAQNVIALRPNQNSLVPEFLYYYLSSEETQGRLGSLNIGVAQPSLKVPHLLALEVNLPSLKVQKRIAGILSAYDELIENNQRRIRILEEMARSLYREWFVHFHYPGHAEVPLVDSPLGSMPQGWEVKRLGDIAESVRRNIPKGQLTDPQPYVGLEHIPRKSLALDDWEVVDELGSNKLAFKKGEVLFGKIRPYFHKVSIAPFEGLCSADTIVIRSKISVDHALVVACVSSDEFVAHASATSNGAKMPRANWNVLTEYSVTIPPKDLTEHFNQVFLSLINQQQVLVSQNKSLSQARDLLLPKLLSGGIRISNLIKTTEEFA